MGIIDANELIIPKKEKEDNKSFLTINEIRMEMEEKPSNNNSCIFFLLF